MHPRPDLHAPPTVALHPVTAANRHRVSSGAGARRQRERPLHRVTGRAAADPLTATRRREKTPELLLCSAVLSIFTLKKRWEQEWSCIRNNDVIYPIQTTAVGGRMGGAWPAGNIPGDRHDVYQKGHMLRLGKKMRKGNFILLSGANLGWMGSTWAAAKFGQNGCSGKWNIHGKSIQQRFKRKSA